MDRGWPSQELEHYLKWSKPEKQVWLLPSLAMLANACLAPQKHQSRGWSYGEGTTSTDTDPLGEGEQQEEKREEKAQAAQHFSFVASSSPGLALPGCPHAQLCPVPAGAGCIPGLGVYKHMLSCGTPALTIPGDLQLLWE